MKTPPKSPQSSPVKRAKRARLMWAVLEADCPIELHQEEVMADMSVDGAEHAGVARSKMPVHVLDASEAAHEQRVASIARIIDPLAFTRGGGDMPYSSHQYARDYAVKKARACLASVYSAPAGKGRAKL